MPKNVNEKALAARERKAATKDAKSAAAEKAAEDRYWKEQGEGAKSKAAAKKDEEAARRAVGGRLFRAGVWARRILHGARACRLWAVAARGSLAAAPPTEDVPHLRVRARA